MVLVNIIIPVYNEADRLPKTLKAFSNYFEAHPTYSYHLKKNTHYILKVIFVLDGCTDQSEKIIKEFLKQENISGSCLVLKKNQGKGFALRQGVLKSAEADYYYLADADLSAKWDVLPHFLELTKTNKYDAVIASRAAAGAKVQTKLVKKIAGRISARIINLILGIKVNDTQCGYKLINRQVKDKIFSNLTIDRWGFDFELLYLMRKAGLTIKEQGITWQHIPESNVSPWSYWQTFWELMQVRRGRRKK
ncbi:MAG: dolichyl-phosphate beta-glucosyltransferase [bacterium]